MPHSTEVIAADARAYLGRKLEQLRVDLQATVDFAFGASIFDEPGVAEAALALRAWGARANGGHDEEALLELLHFEAIQYAAGETGRRWFAAIGRRRAQLHRAKGGAAR